MALLTVAPETSLPMTHARRLVLFVLLGATALLAIPYAASAQDDTTASEAPAEPTAEQRIRVLLNGYDYFPTREDLDAVTDDVPTVLVAIYNDPDAKPTTRGRVIDAMGYYDGETADEFLRYVLDNRAALPSIHVHKALTAHAKAFGDRSLELLRPYLEVDDMQLRITASVAIAKRTGIEGRKILKKRLEVEPEATVRKQIERSLGDTL